MVIDIIFAVLMIISIISGARRGFVKAVWHIGAWVLTGIIVYAALTPATNFLAGTSMADSIYTSIDTSIGDTLRVDNGQGELDTKDLSQKTNLPESVFDGLDENLQSVTTDTVNTINQTTKEAAEKTARSVTGIIIKAIAAVGLFVLVRVMLALLFTVFNGASKLPVIGSVNGFLGGVFSGINMLLGVYLALALISMFANPSIYQYINNTYIIKYLYNENILLQLFMKI